jgi:hypothetical protein
MKYTLICITTLSILLVSCNQEPGNSEIRKNNQDPATYTGVKKFYDQGRLVKETTFKNGIKHGINKNYYDDGRLKRTIMYKDGIREDTAFWYYPEGKVYRATPYRNDRIHGKQIKYYKTGYVQAVLPYRDGLRLPGLEEYLPDGRKVEHKVRIEHEMRDLYESHQLVRILTRLSNKSVNVEFYEGTLTDGVFDPDKCKKVTIAQGQGFIELRKSDTGGKSYVDIIAVHVTRFRNKLILTQRINLPYKDLN